MATQQSSASEDRSSTEKLNYITESERCLEFLSGFKQERAGVERFKYKEILQEIADQRQNVLDIDLNDMIGFFADDSFLDRILRNTMRYAKLFEAQADALMPQPTDERILRAMDGDLDGLTAQQVFRFQRLQQLREQEEERQQRVQNGDELEGMEDNGEQQEEIRRGMPSELMRTYQVVFTPPAKLQAQALRTVSASKIGNLVKIRGVVTKVTDVKPRAVVVTYICDRCGNETYQRVSESGEYNPPQHCQTPDCAKIKKRDKPKVYATVRGSKFEKFQELKVQETPDQVPVGHIPRTLTVHCRDSCTRQCTPGDCVEMVGVFLPLTLNGFHQMKMGLTATTYLSCMKIKREKKSYSELFTELTPEIEDEIDDLASDRQVYDKLAQSIAPEIFGHLDVKKALLLQLVGGVTKKMKDGMSIRGDLNVLLMGDPGVAKSQLLKHIASVAPRGVYTTGKGSSGVGLTACVTRDKATGEVALEGGALVLADMGICAIDEFDKMEEADRTAIHEVMEQQTVSIAKAGVTTTLNARTSILAAANPLYGRYNRRLSPAKNINLPAALLSRFDLLFLLLDTPDIESDTALARHITHVHRHSEHPPLDFQPIRPHIIRAYIAQARRVEPYVPPSLCNQIVEHYVNMRQQDFSDAQDAGTQSMLTARQLLSILRMAQALARLYFREIVEDRDIQEAIRLVKASKLSLEDTDNRENNPEAMHDDSVTKVFHIIRELALANHTNVIKYADVEPVVLARGLTVEHLERTLTEYEEINVFQLNPARTKITIVQAS